MNIAYISHHGRPNYEYEWFRRMPAEKIKFIDVDFSGYPSHPPKNVEYCKVDFVESRLSKGRFHSTASLVRYKNYEKYLEDVDIVIVLEIFSSLSKQFVRYCKQSRKKSVVLVYELIAAHPLHYLPTHIMNRLYVTKYAHQFICVSSKAARSLMALGVSSQKISVVYPGIDLTRFACPAVQKKRPRIHIVFVGGLKPHKGIDIFLAVAQDYLDRRSDVHFSVVGGGPWTDAVQKMATQYHHFHYYDVVKNHDLPAILQEQHIYILPCKDMYRYGIKITSEQFGFSLVEAMACGLAVITTDAGAIPEVVTEQNIICHQNSADAVKAALGALLRDPSRLAAIRKGNVELVKNRYDIVKQAQALYNKLVA